MITRTILGAVLTALALFTTGCGDDSGTTGSSHTSTGAIAATPHNDADITFAQQMIPHHEQAVEMAEFADGRTTNPLVLDLAGRVRAAQTPEIQTMTSWLRSWNAPAADSTETMPGMDHSGHAMPGGMTDEQMATLRDTKDAEFDRQWLTMMIVHHQGAIEMAETELTTGENTDAKALAQKIIDAQEAEIREMQPLIPQS
jgi:uncharacterized protein (DUF305 family)